MSLFETTAYAAPAAGAAPGDAGLINLLFLGGFVLIFYFPAHPAAKQAPQRTSDADGQPESKGDEIVTAGGIVGTINKVEDDFVKMQVGDGVEMRIQKSADRGHVAQGHHQVPGIRLNRARFRSPIELRHQGKH